MPSLKCQGCPRPFTIPSSPKGHNGDKISYSYASKGTVTLKDGKFAGAKGEGTCQGKANADGTATWDCEGTYTPATK
ncbi:MAG: hypothetical protein LAN83_18535 [Acidobacteriia bacterium]|nr:hypothetical protein [Terriglobia bacterium]